MSLRSVSDDKNAVFRTMSLLLDHPSPVAWCLGVIGKKWVNIVYVFIMYQRQIGAGERSNSK